MIARFGADTALLLVDVQRGVDVLEYWGGVTGRRNNPHAESRMGALLSGWRSGGLPVFFTFHDSREPHSPLKASLPTGAFKAGLEPLPGEPVILKDVNGGFIGTSLEIGLRRRRIARLVVVGFFTNMCVETTVRHAGNMGFDTYLIEDACSATNRIGYDGTDYDPETVHALAVASMHGEFCTALQSAEALRLLEGDVQKLQRVQGNRPDAESLG